VLLAAKLGAQVSGLDATEPLLTIARERVPQDDFRTGEMEGLPYSNQTFDVVTGLNSFQFAASLGMCLFVQRLTLKHKSSFGDCRFSSSDVTVVCYTGCQESGQGGEYGNAAL
jgi:hypothetical protein